MFFETHTNFTAFSANKITTAQVLKKVSSNEAGNKLTPQELEEINDRLGAGDKEALKELTSNGINYTIEQKANGQVIKYEYNGEKYQIYCSSNISTKASTASITGDYANANWQPPVRKNTHTFEDNSIQPDEVNLANEYNIDYSGIDKDKPASAFFDIENVKNTSSTIGGQHPDAGGWDNLISELKKIKPQLLEQVKKLIESKGLTYDENTVEKYLNVYITSAIRKLDETTAYKLSNMAQYSSVAMPQNPDFEDIVEYIMARIEEEMGIQETESKNLSNKNDTPFNAQDRYYTLDLYLLDVADALLTEEEKEMKEVLQIYKTYCNDYNNFYNIQDKNKVLSYIETFSTYVKNYLKQKYPNKSEEEINYAVEAQKESLKTNLPKNNGLYSVDQAFTSLMERCLAMFE